MSGAPGVSVATNTILIFICDMVPHEGINLRNWLSFLLIDFRETSKFDDYSVRYIFSQNIGKYDIIAFQIGKIIFQLS